MAPTWGFSGRDKELTELRVAMARGPWFFATLPGGRPDRQDLAHPPGPPVGAVRSKGFSPSQGRRWRFFNDLKYLA